MVSKRKSAQQRNAMVGECWDVFTKRVFGEKHISVSCVKIQGGMPPLCRRAYAIGH